MYKESIFNLLKKLSAEKVDGYSRLFYLNEFYLLITSKRLFLFEEKPLNDFQYDINKSIANILLSDIHFYSDFNLRFSYKGKEFNLTREDYLETNFNIASFNTPDNLVFSSNSYVDTLNFYFKSHPFNLDPSILDYFTESPAQALGCYRLGEFKDILNKIKNIDGFKYNYYKIPEYEGVILEEIYFNGELLLSGMKYDNISDRNQILHKIKIIGKNEHSINEFNKLIIKMYSEYLLNNLSCDIYNKAEEVNPSLIKKN